MIVQFEDENNSNDLKQQLLDYDASKGPFYYQADWVYHFLEEIYREEKDWDKALQMLLKKADYVQSPNCGELLPSMQ